MNKINTYPVGSYEYVSATITADASLDSQPIVMSVDSGDTWSPAEWVGGPGLIRDVRSGTPVTIEKGSRSVYVKLTDNPEIPIIYVGRIRGV